MRRDFLRLGGASALGAFMPSLLDLTMAPSPAYAARVREGMSWEAGFAEMRADVFNNRLGEVSAWFTEGEQNIWRSPHDLGLLGDQAGDAERDDAIAARLVTERPRRAKRGHIHPVVTFISENLLAPDYLEKLARKEVEPALGPPSFRDVVAHIWATRRSFKPANIPFQDIVFDPAGVWTLTMREGAFSQKCYDYYVFLRERLPRALERLALSPRERQALIESMTAFNEAAVQAIGDTEISSLYAEYKDFAIFWYNNREIKRVYENILDEIYQMSIRVSPTERQRMIADVIEAAKPLDIDLSFEPYTTPYTG